MDVFEELAAIKKRERRSLDLINRCLDRIEKLEWHLEQLDPVPPGKQEQNIMNLLDELDAQADAKTAAGAAAKGGAA